MKPIVLKIGGSVQEKLPDAFYETLIELQQSKTCSPVIVHGGGPLINQMLDKLDIPTHFVNGLRVTTNEVLQVVEMVLNGWINKELVTQFQKRQVTAVGLCGVDHGLLLAEPASLLGDLGYVGKVKEVNVSILHTLLEQNIVPVISPVGMDETGQHYNINGDMAASAIAKALGGKLVFISDIAGVMEQKGNQLIVHESLTLTETERLIQSGIITGGMIPKVRSALSGLSFQMQESVILNGTKPEDLMDYVNGKKVGTKFLYRKEDVYV